MWDSIRPLSGALHALLAALKERDTYTSAHSDRTAALASSLGKRCGLTTHQLNVLNAAAAVHDIGKVGIPDSVLLKPGRLDVAEWELMKTHPVIGARVLSQIPVPEVGEVATLVRHHHERFDGSGYPDGLTGDSIPFMSRIIAVVDAYDAMATTRPYHRPKPHRAIMDIMHGENGGHYDPWLLTQFTELVEKSEYRADRYAGDPRDS